MTSDPTSARSHGELLAEAGAEALTGDRAGRLFSRVREFLQDANAVGESRSINGVGSAPGDSGSPRQLPGQASLLAQIQLGDFSLCSPLWMWLQVLNPKPQLRVVGSALVGIQHPNQIEEVVFDTSDCFDPSHSFDSNSFDMNHLFRSRQRFANRSKRPRSVYVLNLASSMGRQRRLSLL